MAKLFTTHLPSLQVAFSDLKRQALEQTLVFAGTPGSVTTREVNGRRFFYRQHYDPQDKKSAEYIGPVDDPAAGERVQQLRERIATANALLATARLLARAGYLRVDARTDAILAALANNEFFRAGGVLVGAQSFGALLNDLGARAAGYATEDIDVARNRALELREPKSFEAMLADSKVPLLQVPQLDRNQPSTSFKTRGADRLRVDLLAPTAGDTVRVLAVRELKAHATGLPYLRYLLEAPLETVVLGRSAVVPVKVPRPERLAWHKMLTSSLRSRTSDKRAKDIEQAAVMFTVVSEREPGALEDGWRDVPRSARTGTKAAARLVLSRLEEAGHERAKDLLQHLLGPLG